MEEVLPNVMTPGRPEASELEPVLKGRPKRERTGWGRTYIITAAIIVILVVAWQLSSYVWSDALRNVMASPTQTVRYIAGNWSGSIDALRITAIEAALGYVAGNLGGFIVGVICAEFRVAGRAVFPLLVIAQAVPVITFSSIVILWFGNDINARAVLSLYLCFFPMTLNIYRSLADVPPEMTSLMAAFGAKRVSTLRLAKLPYVMPAFITALKVSTVLAVAGAIVGELFGARTGLGVLLLGGLYYLSGAEVWASIVLSAVLSLFGYVAILLIERRLRWW